MAVTQDSFTGNGSKTDYDFTFPYLKQSEIKASLDGTPTTNFRHLTATKIQFVNNTTDNTPTAPAADVKIKIYRETDTSSLAATFYAGSAIKSEDLNDNFTQNVYATQEVTERYLSNLGGTMTGDLNLGEDVIIKFEGASDNAHETTLTVTDPTADRTITLPNETGTVITTASTEVIDSDHYVDGSIDLAHMSPNSVDSDQYVDGSIDLVHMSANSVDSNQYVDGSIDHIHLSNDCIDGDNIQDDSINSEHYVAGSIDNEHLADDAVGADELAADAVVNASVKSDAAIEFAKLENLDSAKILVGNASNKATEVSMSGDVVISNTGATTIQTGAVEHAMLSGDCIDGDNIQDDVIESEHYAAGSIDTEHIANANVTLAKIEDVADTKIIVGNGSNRPTAVTVSGDVSIANTGAVTIANNAITAAKITNEEVTTAKLADSELRTLAGMQSGTASVLADSTALTSSTAELNILDNKSFRASGDGALSTTSDTEIPSSKVIANHVAAQLGTVGGFTTIATEVAFPATASQPAAGVIISISDAAGIVVNGSGVSTTGRTTDGTPATVTINSFPSSLNGETLASGVGLLVTSTGSGNTYTYHKILAAESDVKQLSDDINDFNARYRVAGSAPGSNNDAGDMYFDTSANKMKVYNGTTSAWDDVASVGNFYINTLSSSSGTGGGSATFNGSAYRFTLSNAPTMAQQLIVSVNGVIQKPNAGSSQPSEGFAISGNDIIFSAAPASGSDYFIVTQGSSVSIGTPSDNTVATAKIQNLAVTNAKIANDTIAEGKLDVHNAPATGKYLKYTSNGMEWADGASEGTDVKSTTVTGTTKFLRVDGDGTCSWQVPPDTTYSVQDGQLSQNNFTDTLKTKLDGVAASANNYAISADLLDEDNMSSNSDSKVPSQQSVKAYVDTQVGAISAAPEITAVATGSIGANAAVQLNSNGTVSVVSQAAPTTGTMRQFNGSTSSHYGACYNKTDKVVAVVYKTSSGGQIRFGTVSGDEITFSGETQFSNTNNVESCTIGHDETNNVYFLSWRNEHNGYGYACTLTANSTTYGTKSSEVSWASSARECYFDYVPWVSRMVATRFSGSGSGRMNMMTYNGPSNAPTFESAVSFNNTSSGGFGIAIDPDNERIHLAYNNTSASKTYFRSHSVSGTSITSHNDQELKNSQVYYMKSVYDTTNNKSVMTFTDASDGEQAKVIVATYTDNDNSSFSNIVDLQASGNSLYPAMVFNSDTGKVDYYAKDDSNDLYYVSIDASGTHPTASTKIDVVTTANNNFSHAIFDSDTLQSFNFFQGADDHGDYISRDSGTTTLTSENFIGFSSAAYTNGQTATINVVGNTTTQSSLTPAQKYYVLKDGTIGLTATNPSVEAGVALSATKLLIKG